jgi:cell division protein FtsL
MYFSKYIHVFLSLLVSPSAFAADTVLGQALGNFGDLIWKLAYFGFIGLVVYIVFVLIGGFINSLELKVRNTIRKLEGKPSIEKQQNDQYQENLKQRDLNNKKRLLEEYSEFNMPGRYVMYSDRGTFVKTCSIKDALNFSDVLNRIEAGEVKDFKLRDIDTVHYHQH